MLHEDTKFATVRIRPTHVTNTRPCSQSNIAMHASHQAATRRTSSKTKHQTVARSATAPAVCGLAGSGRARQC